MFSKNNHLLSVLEISLYFLPASFLLGTLIVNLNLIIFIFLATTYLILNKIKIILNISNLTLFTFFLVIILSSYKNINQIGIENFLKSIFLLKFYLLYILIETLLFQRKLNIKYFFNVCLVLSVLLSLDLVLQFFYGKNILGYEPWEGRITGIFRDEAIAGSYIQKVFVFSLISLFSIFYPSHKYKTLIVIAALSLIVFGSYIASNRISFLILISFMLIVTLLIKELRKNLILVILILLPIFYHFYQNDLQTNQKYKGFFSMTKSIMINLENKLRHYDQNNQNFLKKENTSLKKNRMTTHEKLFLTSFQSFKENIFLGSGHKSFRFKCQIFVKKKDSFACSTHPHNYHLEILHDTGIIGLIFLSLFVFSLLYKATKKLTSKELNYNEKIILALLIINFLFIIFPLKSTGSLFTTWNGALLWLSVSLINYGNQK